MSLGLEKRVRGLLEKLEELEITQVGDTIEKEHREQIARELGKSEDTIRRYLNSWVKAGYLSKTGGRGRQTVTYTLLYDLEEIKRREAGVLEELKEDRLIEKMEKEKKEFLKKLSSFTAEVGLPNSISSSNKTLFEKKEAQKSEHQKIRFFNTDKEKKSPILPQNGIRQTDPHGKENTITFTNPLGEVKELGESIPSPVHHFTTEREIGESIPVEYSCRDCIHFNNGRCEVYPHLSPEALKTSWFPETCPSFRPRREGYGEED